MKKGPVLRVVAVSGGRTPYRSEMHSRSYGLSEAQVQAVETEPAPG
jgi:hypothetical protein